MYNWWLPIEGYKADHHDLGSVACFAAAELMRQGAIGTGALRALVDFLEKELLTQEDQFLITMLFQAALAVNPETAQVNSFRTFPDFFWHKFLEPMREIAEDMTDQDISRLDETKKFCFALSQVIMENEIEMSQYDGRPDRRRLVAA